MAAHADLVAGTLERDGQHIIVDGLSDKIDRLQLETLNGQFHVAVSRQHNHFCFGRFLFDPLEQFDAVHDRHFDVGDDNGWLMLSKNIEALLAVSGGVDMETEVGQINT